MSGSQESPDTGKVCECVSGVPRYRKSVRVGVRSPQIQEKCASGGQESPDTGKVREWGSGVPGPFNVHSVGPV